MKFFSLSISIVDPGFGAFLTPWIRDPGWVKKRGSGMNNPDHISESLETNFLGKIFKLFDGDPGFGIRDEKSRIRDPGWKTFGSGIHPGQTSRIRNTAHFMITTYALG
jgi:hypothetical protein